MKEVLNKAMVVKKKKKIRYQALFYISVGEQDGPGEGEVRM